MKEVQVVNDSGSVSESGSGMGGALSEGEVGTGKPRINWGLWVGGLVLVLVGVMGAVVAWVKLSGLAVVEEEKMAASKETSQEYTGEKYKILHIMSYHTPWKWTEEQIDGFMAAFEGIDVELKVFEMDTKRNSSKDWMEAKGKEARELIESWQPNLVYVNDDNVQTYVTKYYLDSEIPFVFSGVNGNPEEYGFTESENVAGVLEEEHAIQTVRLLTQIDPSIERVAVITDDGETWPRTIARIKERSVRELRGINFVAYDIVKTFAKYQEKIEEYQTSADAIVHIGIFSFRDAEGNNVAMEDVMKWTVENSKLPDGSFWSDRVDLGNLAAVTVSGYDQGQAAGLMARDILVRGMSPKSFPMEITSKGSVVLNLTRANDLGLQIDTRLLSVGDVVEGYRWEQE